MHLRLLALAGLLLVQSAHAQGFNCRYARTPDEIAICRDARLSQLDERLSYGFRLKEAGGSSGERRHRWAEAPSVAEASHGAWGGSSELRDAC